MAIEDRYGLTKKNLLLAERLLFTVTKLLESNNIPYHLEGGTLLGIVRDGALLPWDHDVDISIPFKYSGEILKLKIDFLKKGYKVSTRKNQKTYGPMKQNQLLMIKIKPLVLYIINWFIPKYNQLTLDIFIKTNDENFTYWQAREKIMRVENKFYKSFDTVEFKGRLFKVPNFYQQYLTQKYGNWSVPVKAWDCSKDELTII